MTKINNYLFCLILSIFFIPSNSIAQTVNFDETWKEFLDNNKISNMSELTRPNKTYDPVNYIKYLLMNTNNSFCQSKIENAEKLVAEINEIDARAHQSIPGFIRKKEDLEAKIKAYHIIDRIWKQFIRTKEVNLAELENIKEVKTICEKRTLAKYSFMTAYHHFCQGNVSEAKNIIENRTLKLTEKTTLRVADIEGLAPELAKMKSLFQNITKLQANWKNYIKTGVSPGFDMELPLFACYPIPNMKEWVLKGVLDVCTTGPIMLEKIKKSQVESGITIDKELKGKIKELEAAIQQNEKNLTVLNKSWEAFISTNTIEGKRKYGYEYCQKEPLVRAYIMDGFINVCGNGEEVLQKIDQMQQTETLKLTEVTIGKINELTELYIQTLSEEDDINELWNQFVAQGDTLYEAYHLAEFYCDHVYDVKSWLIQGFSGTCKEGIPYLEQIDEVQKTLEFEFTKDVRCRITKLRTKIWDCQYQALRKLASVQTTADSLEMRLEVLVEEYGIGKRPEVCVE